MDTVTDPQSPTDGGGGASSGTAQTTSAPPAAPTPAGAGPSPAPGFAPPPGQGPPPGYGYGWGGWPAPGPWDPAAAPAPAAGDRHGLGKVLRSATTAWIVAAVLAIVVVGLSAALASTHSGTVRIVGPAGGVRPGIGGTAPGVGGGRFGGAAGLGTFGTVASVGSGSFTVTDRTGQTITVNEQSSTVYYSGQTQATSSVVVTGARVIVRGTVSGQTVTATTVTVLPAGGLGFVPGGAPAA